MSMALQAGRFNPSRGRRMRRPTHRFYAVNYPWELQPVAIAPVLPGEMLMNANWQARIVTDPLRNPLMGWWAEYYLFYVPMSMLPSGASFVTQVEAGDLNTPIAAAGPADQATYYAGLGINWTRECYNLIVREWFREEDEQAAAPLPSIRSGYAAVKTQMDGLHHSLRTDANYPGTTGGALGATQRAQEDAYRTYEFLRTQGLIQMTYEDYLKTYGVRDGDPMRPNRPYLLRYVRDWQYPSNTVNQTTGTPVSAVSWALNHRADKRRFFKEPGFLMLLSSFRPKVIYANQDAAGVAVLDRLRYWAPALLRDDPLTSLRADTATSSPLYDAILATDHWIDVRDLFIHGDQFINSEGVVGTAPIVLLPTSAGEAKYATAVMAEQLFTNPGSGGYFYVKQDGTLRLNIRAATEDATDATAET